MPGCQVLIVSVVIDSGNRIPLWSGDGDAFVADIAVAHHDTEASSADHVALPELI